MLLPQQRKLGSLIRCLSSLFGQRIEIISLFLEQSLFYQSLDSIKYRCSSLRIISAGFEQFMQIKRVLFPLLKTSQYAFCKFVHGRIALREIRGPSAGSVACWPPSHLHQEVRLGLWRRVKAELQRRALEVEELPFS